MTESRLYPRGRKGWRRVAHPLVVALGVVVVGTTFPASAGRGGAPCPAALPDPGLERFYSDGWGMDPRNTRHQGPARTTIRASNVSRLELKWTHALATYSPRSMPLVTEDTVFVGDSGRGLLALDRETGCVRWEFAHGGEIGSAILHQQTAEGVRLLFADRQQGIFAVDARDGRLVWHARPHSDNPVALYSGTPLVHRDTLFVPLSSQEIGLTLVPFYGCCHTRGGLAAMDTANGETRWYLPTIDERARTTGRRWLTIKKRGPSGAPVWSAPAYDDRRDVVYFGTGQNYSHPTTDTSDAIFAVDAATGKRRWVRQFTENDAYNISCDGSPAHPNCPDPLGPDLDFGAPPVLVDGVDGADLVIAGQKSGDVYALSADDATVVWQRKLGRGGSLGGVHWGTAFNPAQGVVVVPISDIGVGRMTGPGPARPGVYALGVEDGDVVWSRERESRCAERVCWGGISAAVTVTDEVVFAGSLDGFLEALDAASGEVLWSFDTWREFEAVGGKVAIGGAFDAHGPMVADNLVIVSSGYASFGQRGGNALLVFELAGEPES